MTITACTTTPRSVQHTLGCQKSGMAQTRTVSFRKEERFALRAQSQGKVTARAASTGQEVRQTDWAQKVVTIPHKPRGCHIITRDLVQELPELSKFRVGTANFFVMHTSCSLTINENASPDVPKDLNDALDTIVPEGTHYRHLDEGLDDMPAHVKSSMMGCSLTIPISKGRLVLGTWQGIYLNEHRNYGGPRQICVTVCGMRQDD